MRPTLATLFFCLLICTPGSASAKPKLAVMTIVDASKKLQPAVVDSLTDALRIRLATGDRFIVIDKSRHAAALKRIVKEQRKESYKSCVDSACQIPLGRALSADTLLRTKLSQVGSSFLINAELVDLAKEAVVGAAQATTSAEAKDRDDRLLEAIYGVADQLVQPSAPKPTESRGGLPKRAHDEATDLPPGQNLEDLAPAPSAPSVTSAPREETTPPPPTVRRRGTISTQTIYGWSAVVLGAIGMGLGGLQLLALPGKIDDVDDATSPSALEAAADEAKSTRTTGFLMLGAGAAAVVVGAIMIWTAPSRKPHRIGVVEVESVPSIAALQGGGAVSVGGRF